MITTRAPDGANNYTPFMNIWSDIGMTTENLSRALLKTTVSATIIPTNYQLILADDWHSCLRG